MKLRNLQFCIFIILLKVLQTKGQSQPLPGKNNTFRLPGSYTKEHRPSITGEATTVEVNVHVQAINPIKAADMDFRMDMTLTQRWIDDRLKFSDEWFDSKSKLILPTELIDQIWHPHPFVVNAKSTDVGQLAEKLISVYIYKNRTVQYSINVFATVACSMNYRYYPYDSQLCPMYIESFSFDETQVKYVWADTEAFTINIKLRMLQFEPGRPLRYGEASVPRYNEAKNFSQLIAYFRFDRLLGNHLIQTFAPCSLVVCLSWFSFWLELNALSARMSLLVTSILTLVTQFVGLKADLPPVAYIKAVDIWMAGCMIWVFGALGEFVLVKVFFSMTEDAKFTYHEHHMRIFAQVGNGRTNNGAMTNTQNRTGNIDPSNNEQPMVRPSSDTEGRGMDDRQDEIQTALSPQQLRRRRLMSLERKGSFDTRSIATTSSANLERDFGKVKIPLQWIDPKTGNMVLLWKTIDNFCKWIFPLTFVIFCTIYWITLYIHSITSNAIQNAINTNANTTNSV